MKTFLFILIGGAIAKCASKGAAHSADSFAVKGADNIEIPSSAINSAAVRSSRHFLDSINTLQSTKMKELSEINAKKNEAECFQIFQNQQNEYIKQIKSDVKNESYDFSDLKNFYITDYNERLVEIKNIFIKNNFTDLAMVDRITSKLKATFDYQISLLKAPSKPTNNNSSENPDAQIP
jgi:hypothetical protein